MRQAVVNRKTTETEISVSLLIDGVGDSIINTPIRFFSHMLEAFTKNGVFDVRLQVDGDLEVDQHHTIEDTGLVLGNAFRNALMDKKGINRSGYFVYPMDDALAVVSVDLSGRPYLNYNVDFKRRYCGELDTDLVEDFFYGFSVGMMCNIAIKMPYGRSDHHKIEAIFKAFGKAMKMACEVDIRVKDRVLSTKGII